MCSRSAGSERKNKDLTARKLVLDAVNRSFCTRSNLSGSVEPSDGQYMSVDSGAHCSLRSNMGLTLTVAFSTVRGIALIFSGSIHIGLGVTGVGTRKKSSAAGKGCGKGVCSLQRRVVLILDRHHMDTKDG